ncbi:Tyrosinase [Cytospora mali]|uniref:Tyrosinase n=1 Tax=Cytospora mali TaxID=578113 RepID=A0A194VAU2_CYTMA|nr:Tyrosinase [Valsa mali var. pyri (nom. inval.)]
MFPPSIKSAILGILSLPCLGGALSLPRRDDNRTCTSLNQRKAWHTLTDDEKAEYLRAEKCLMSRPTQLNIEGAKNRWDEVQWAHIVQSNDVHGVGQFLPWHRYYVRAHEALLQQECNYTGAQPYWDEQRDADAGPIEDASVWGTGSLSFGTGGREGDGCVVDGPFANTTLRLDMDWGVTKYDEYCLSRNFTRTYWPWANSTYADECYAMTNYEDAWECYIVKPHSSAHLAVSGTMKLASASPGDPLFFLHHANLDRLWWIWQQADLSSRLNEMSGRNVPTISDLESNEWLFPSDSVLDYDGDTANVTTMDHVLWVVDLLPNVTVADVMDIRGDVICAEYIEVED